ncbi:MAG: YggS family pyridoxal phosphate-dependent enzyme [Bacteriovorax sp.]|nr:YggS family pyridoxal phosphate-dependent enzyme [Bacteriovorax sp.]
MINHHELDIRLRDLKVELAHATLVAVSKYSPIEDVIEAYKCGQIDFGENRVSELKTKADIFQEKNFSNVRWHFIGVLQTNKVKDLLKTPNLWAIHSVSSKKIVEELIKRESEFTGIELKLFFQFNTSHEAEKTGFETIEELQESIELIRSLKNSKLKLFGLMTMGAIRTDNVLTDAVKCFQKLKIIRALLVKNYNLELKLSMGMSGDYKEALEEGADFVRIGSLIFK